MRALCLVSRDYPPQSAQAGGRSRAALAGALARHGIAVHVLTTAGNGGEGHLAKGGVTVHFLRATDDSPLGWARVVAEAYRRVDALVGFDAVLAPANSESLYLLPAPSVPLLLLEGLSDNEDEDDLRLAPERAVVSAGARIARQRADLVLVPRGLAQSPESSRHAELTLPFAPAATPTDRRPSEAAIELVYLGALEGDAAPELLIEVLARLKAAGTAAHATFVGVDSRSAPLGDSYRRAVLLPRLRAVHLDLGDVRFVERCDPGELAAHLATAAAAVLPGIADEHCLAALECLAAGLPVLTRATSPLLAMLPRDAGLVGLPADDPTAFTLAACDAIGDLGDLHRASTRSREAVAVHFGVARAAAELLSLLDAAAPAATLPASRREPRATSPRLGALVIAGDDPAATRRTIASLLSMTDVPFMLIAVCDEVDSEIGRLREDPRLVIAPAAANSAAARNDALARFAGELDAVAFVSPGVELLAKWWEPFTEALERDPALAIITETAAGASFEVVRASAFGVVGRFAEGGDADLSTQFSRRAARIGFSRTAIESGRVLAHGDERGAGLPAERGDPEPGELFVVLADAREVLERPELLACYTAAFTAADPAALVLYGPGLDPSTYPADLAAAAARVGCDLEDGPRLIAKLAEVVDAGYEAQLAEEAHCRLGEALTGVFGALAPFHADEAASLRVLAARAWGAAASFRQRVA